MIENLSLINYGYYISDNLTEKSTERLTNCFEIELYTTSDGISFVDGKQIPHKKCNVLIVKPNQTRQSIGLFECYYVHMKCLDKQFEERYLNVLPQFIDNCDTVKLSNIFELIIDLNTYKNKGYELHTISALIELIAILYSSTAAYKPKDSKFNTYKYNIIEATKFIQDNCSEHLTLSDIAKFSNLSPSYFHAAFKNIVGMTPHKYLLNARLKKAQKLLLNTKMGISEIAEECGFVSQIYLNYIFKKELHITPKQYRDTEKTIII